MLEKLKKINLCEKLFDIFDDRLGKKLVTACQRGTNGRRSGDAVLHQEP